MVDINDILYRLLAGDFSEKDRQELDNWLQKSDGNRQHYEELMNAEDLVDSYSVFHAIDKNAAWHRFIKRKKSRKSFFPSPYLKVAAALLLFLTAGAVYWYSQYTKVTPPEIPETVQLAIQQSRETGKQGAEMQAMENGKWEMKNEKWGVEKEKETDIESANLSSLSKDQLLSARRITTRHDKEFWLTLDDGTLVHLNYNTHLIYPERFGRGSRNVVIEGEAYFMVAKDRSRPFIVHTLDGDVRVYGTEFNVNSKDVSTTIVLVEGTVSVTPTGGREQMMRPNEQATIDSNTSSSRIEPVDVNPYIAWHTGSFAFVNYTIEDIARVLSNWYNVEIIISDESIKKERFSGFFDKYLPKEQVFDAISKSSNLSIHHQDGKVYIQR
ncbi:MAG: FecR domain-containing protein [Prevotella sp.]|nr:FecR domain-containing protein [Prevotella sp.]